MSVVLRVPCVQCIGRRTLRFVENGTLNFLCHRRLLNFCVVRVTLRGASPAEYSRSDSFASTVNARPTPVPTKRQLDLGGAADTPKKARSPATATAAKTASPAAVSPVGNVKREILEASQQARPSSKARPSEGSSRPRPSAKVEVAEHPAGFAQPVGGEATPAPRRPPVKPTVKQDPQVSATSAPPTGTAAPSKAAPAAPRAKASAGAAATPGVPATGEEPVPVEPAKAGSVGSGSAEQQSTEAVPEPAGQEPTREEMERDLEDALERELERDGQHVVLQTLLDPPEEELVDTDALIASMDSAMARASKEITVDTPVSQAHLLLHEALMDVVKTWCAKGLESVVDRLQQHPFFMEYLAEVESEAGDPDYKFGLQEPALDVIHFYMWLDRATEEQRTAEAGKAAAAEVKAVRSSKGTGTGLRLAPAVPMPAPKNKPASDPPLHTQAEAKAASTTPQAPKAVPTQTPQAPKAKGPCPPPAKAPGAAKDCETKARAIPTPQVPHAVPKVAPNPKADTQAQPKPPPAKAAAPGPNAEATQPAKAAPPAPAPKVPQARKPAVLEIEKRISVTPGAKAGVLSIYTI